MPRTISVGHFHRRRDAGEPTVAAEIEGYEVWFRGRALATAPDRGDPFLAVALLPAMYAGAELDLRHLPPVSAPLLASLDRIQEIWTTWNPMLHRIAIRAHEAPVETPAGRPPGTLFSGGVDAVYAVLTGADPTEELVFVTGFDFDMTPEDAATASERVARMASTLGHGCSVVDTNWIRFTRHHRIARSTSHGSCLHAIAHLAAPPRMTIASSYAWDHLHPWGTHPLLDPLWSSDLTAIRHLGCDATRAEKVARIAERPELLEALWVCHVDPRENCGRCPKCLRTLAVLRLVGAPTPGFRHIGKDPIGAWLDETTRSAENVFLEEFVALAERRGASPTLRRRLAATERAIARRRALRALRKELRRPRPTATRPVDDLRPWGFGPNPFA